MSWSYGNNPTGNAIDEIRFLTTDTDQTKVWTLSNEEIQYNINLYSPQPFVPGQSFLTAAYCADTIFAKFKAVAQSKSVGDLHIQYGHFEDYAQLARTLRNRASLQLVVPQVTGTSFSDKIGVDSDPDRVGTAVKVDGMDYVGNVPSNGAEDDPSVGP